MIDTEVPEILEEGNKHSKKNCAPNWLYLQDCKINFYVTDQGDHTEYMNMMAVVKLPVNSHVLILLYQPYRHTCCILENIITVYTNSDMLTYLVALRHH